MATRRILALVLAMAGSPAGCGGEVVVTPGTGGTSGATTGGGAGGGSTGTNTTTGPVGPASCEDACAALGSSPWCGADASCYSACNAASMGKCAAQFAGALQCIAEQAEATNCWLDDTCQDAIASWGQCLGYPSQCDGGAGSGDTTQCSGSASCSDVAFEADCQYFDLSWDCHCSIQGVPVGNCAGDGPSSCDPFAGCCAAYF